MHLSIEASRSHEGLVSIMCSCVYSTSTVFLHLSNIIHKTDFYIFKSLMTTIFDSLILSIQVLLMGSLYMVQKRFIKISFQPNYLYTEIHFWTSKVSAVYGCIRQYTSVYCILYIWIIYQEYVNNPTFHEKLFELCSLSAW